MSNTYNVRIEGNLDIKVLVVNTFMAAGRDLLNVL